MHESLLSRQQPHCINLVGKLEIGVNSFYVYSCIDLQLLAKLENKRITSALQSLISEQVVVGNT